MGKDKAGEQTQAIGFVRVASKKDLIKNPFNNQKDVIQRYADLHEIDIVEWIESLGSRNHLEELIEASMKLRDKNINKILVCSYDRLGRDHRYVSEVRSLLSKLGVEIVSVNKSSSAEFDGTVYDKFMQDLQTMICRLDNQSKSGIVKRGLVSRASQGYAMHVIPFGYSKTSTKGLFEISSDGIALKHLLKSFTNGDMTVDDLRNDFSRIYYKDDSKKLVNKIQFNRIVANPYYAGYVAHGGQLYDGLHVPLLTKDEYNKLKELLG